MSLQAHFPKDFNSLIQSMLKMNYTYEVFALAAII